MDPAPIPPSLPWSLGHSSTGSGRPVCRRPSDSSLPDSLDGFQYHDLGCGARRSRRPTCVTLPDARHPHHVPLTPTPGTGGVETTSFVQRPGLYTHPKLPRRLTHDAGSDARTRPTFPVSCRTSGHPHPSEVQVYPVSNRFGAGGGFGGRGPPLVPPGSTRDRPRLMWSPCQWKTVPPTTVVGTGTPHQYDPWRPDTPSVPTPTDGPSPPGPKDDLRCPDGPGECIRHHRRRVQPPPSHNRSDYFHCQYYTLSTVTYIIVTVDGNRPGVPRVVGELPPT